MFYDISMMSAAHVMRARTIFNGTFLILDKAEAFSFLKLQLHFGLTKRKFELTDYLKVNFLKAVNSLVCRGPQQASPKPQKGRKQFACCLSLILGDPATAKTVGTVSRDFRANVPLWHL